MSCGCENQNGYYETVSPFNPEYARKRGIRPVQEQSISDSNGGTGETALTMADSAEDSIEIKTNRSPAGRPTAARFLYFECSDGFAGIQIKNDRDKAYRPLGAMAPEGFYELPYTEPSTGEQTSRVYLKNSAGGSRTIYYAARCFEYPPNN